MPLTQKKPKYDVNEILLWSFVANRLQEGRKRLLQCTNPMPDYQANVSLNTHFATILSRMWFRSHGRDNVSTKLPVGKRNRIGTVNIFTSQVDKPQRRVNKASYYWLFVSSFVKTLASVWIREIIVSVTSKKS